MNLGARSPNCSKAIWDSRLKPKVSRFLLYSFIASSMSSCTNLKNEGIFLLWLGLSMNLVHMIPSRKFYIDPEPSGRIRSMNNPSYDLGRFILLTNLNPDSDGLQSSISIRSTVSAIPLSRSPRTALIWGGFSFWIGNSNSSIRKPLNSRKCFTSVFWFKMAPS